MRNRHIDLHQGHDVHDDVLRGVPHDVHYDVLHDVHYDVLRDVPHCVLHYDYFHSQNGLQRFLFHDHYRYLLNFENHVNPIH